jgi:hypothetical protein
MKIRLVKYEKLNFLEALHVLQFSQHWYTDSQKDINFTVFSFSGFEKSLNVQLFAHWPTASNHYE